MVFFGGRRVFLSECKWKRICYSLFRVILSNQPEWLAPIVLIGEPLRHVDQSATTVVDRCQRIKIECLAHIA